MTYSASVHSKLTIDKDGTQLRELDVKSNGYEDRDKLNDAIKNFNKDSVLETYKDTPDWRVDLWNYMYFNFLRRLKRWKKYRL